MNNATNKDNHPADLTVHALPCPFRTPHSPLKSFIPEFLTKAVIAQLSVHSKLDNMLKNISPSLAGKAHSFPIRPRERPGFPAVSALSALSAFFEGGRGLGMPSPMPLPSLGYRTIAKAG
ncbi:MAG: hypothetical protein JWQ04_448 [Pedosphaera sp.]|nr:hypothetical protein [Pedosphaera sp.]